jgi:hypothetical protein
MPVLIYKITGDSETTIGVNGFTIGNGAGIQI